MLAEPSAAAPDERPPLDPSEATAGAEDAGAGAAAVQDTDGDGNRSPDSISGREKINICLLWQQGKPQGTMGLSVLAVSPDLH